MTKDKKETFSVSAADIKHFEQLADELKAAKASSLTAAGGIGDLCAKYHKIEPILKKVLPFIRLIPKIGKTAADAIEFLMGIADMACPVN
jgi:hypothetical protein